MTQPSLARSRYRALDAVTKLGAVLALAVALDVGIASTAGLALALAGAALGVSTVFVTEDTQ